MHITEASGNREVGADGLQSVDNGQDVLGLGVQGVVVNILVVHTVLLATGDTNLHLQPLLHRRRALEVRRGGADVELDGLLGQVDHVRREERLAVLLEVLLVRIEHAVQPRQQLLCAVICVEANRNFIRGGNSADEVSGSDGASDGGGLVAVGHALAGEEGGATLGHLQDDGRLGVAGGLEGGDHRRRRGDVDGGDGELVLAGVLEQSKDIVTDDNSSLAGENVLNTHVCEVLRL